MIALESRQLYLRNGQGKWQQGQMANLALAQPTGLIHGEAAIEEYQRLCNR